MVAKDVGVIRAMPGSLLGRRLPVTTARSNADDPHPTCPKSTSFRSGGYDERLDAENPKAPLRVATLTMLLALGTAPSAFAQPAQRAEPLSEEQAHSIAVDAYVYLYPLVTMEVTRRQATNIEPGKGSAVR